MDSLFTFYFKIIHLKADWAIFWNFLATITTITKVAQMFGDFWGSCENHRFLSPIGESTFWATFKKLVLLFIPTSGHSA